MSASIARSVPRLDHAALVAAVAPAASARALAARREACKQIAAQVYRVVAAVLGPGSPDVGDASQEAFMRVYHAIPSFAYDPDRPHGPTAWVNQIALRAALDRLRDQGRQLELHHDGEPEGLASDDDLERALDAKQLVTALLERLNEKERAVLVLKYWNGETDDEIADTLGIPLGTVKTRLRSAAQKLKRGAAVHDAPRAVALAEGVKA
jgi:RNA polymerase sigma-70 factor (ECF subfamily)